MSNLVFPAMPGIQWFGGMRSPQWKTTNRETDSGRDFSRSHWSRPRYQYKLSYELLRAGAEQELQTLIGFFNQVRGNHDTWLFDDPSDNAVTSQQFAVGDGATATFQLLRSMGSWVDPVYDLNGSPQISIADWQGVSLCSAVARTNRVLYSEQLQQAPWALTGGSVTADAATAPTGVATSADLFKESGGTSGHVIRQEGSGLFDATQPVTVSAYVKAAGRTSFNLYMFDGPTTSYVRATFDLTAGTVLGHQAAGGSSSYLEASITPLANGWCFVTLAGVPGSNTTPAGKQIQFRLLDGGGSEAYTGDNASGVYIWGVQVEQASIAGRYIRTSAAQATVTDYAIDTKGAVTFAAAPAVGAQMSWTGSYYWRCKFLKSQLDLEQFLHQLWQAKSIEFRTTKP